MTPHTSSSGVSGHFSRPSPPISVCTLLRPLRVGLCAPAPLSRSDRLQGSLPPSSAQLRFCLPTCLMRMNALHPLTTVFSASCSGYLCPYLVSLGPVSPVWAGSLLDHLRILLEPSPSLTCGHLQPKGVPVVCPGSLRCNSF